MHMHQKSSFVFLFSLLFLCFNSGCSKIDTRYNDTISTQKNYSRVSDTSASSPHVQRYNLGKDNAATAIYNYRVGQRQPLAPRTYSNSADQSALQAQQPQQTQLITLDATDILFEFDKAVIRKEYYPHLNEWVEFFKENPSITADIYGHTDSTGSKKYNQGLSQKRAQSIYKYLVNKGIAASRLHPVGFGETQPVSTNSTKEGRQKNRRVELNIKK